MYSKYPTMPQTYKLVGYGTNSEGEKIQIDFGEVSDLKIKTSHYSVCSCSGMLEMPWQRSKGVVVSFSAPAFDLEVLTGKKEEEMAKGQFIAAIFPNKDGIYTTDAKVYYYEVESLDGLSVGDTINVLSNTRITKITQLSAGSIKKDPYGATWLMVVEIFRDVDYNHMPVKFEALSTLGAWSKIINYDIKKEEKSLTFNISDLDMSKITVPIDSIQSIYAEDPLRISFKNSQEFKVYNMEDKNMNMRKLMGDFMFGKFDNTTVKYSFNGIAFQSADGTYNVYNEDGTLTNVSDMVMDIPVFAIPVAKAELKVGDVILHPADKTPLVVKENAQTAIIAVEPKSNEVKTFAPKKSIFGFDFYTKIMTPMDMFGGANANADNPFGNMLPFLMMGDGNTDMSTMLMFTIMNGANSGAMDMNAMLPLLMLSDKSGGDNKDFLMAMLMMKGFGTQKN